MAQGPRFNYFDLKQCKRGDVYRVELSSALNVLLVDSSGLSAFKARRQYRYWGGLITRSPHDFVIPRSGHWYLIYHAWGLRSGGRISIRPLVEAEAMPRATPNIVSLQSIAEAAAEYPGTDDAPGVAPSAKDYDVFISHASEDKDEIVRELAGALDSEGLDVWYDEFELAIGSSLRRSIDHGLANSRFGVVVLSSAFFKRNWPNYELDGLVTREMASEGQQLILPIWHNVTKDEVIRYSPSLADKLALRTTDSTVSELAAEIASVIRGS
ncbi:MAG: DUF1883 domain-containing protein [Thermoleophilaceae bacterium]